MNIIAAVDNKYVQHCGVMVGSLLENTSNKHKITIYIVYKKINKKNKKLLKELIEKYNSKIIFKKIDLKNTDKLKISKHINETTYYRIKIPELFPKLKKALYLDCDLIIKKDIWRLYKINLKDKYLAAVKDIGFKDYNSLRIPPKSGYFNAGVTLINLDLWRKNNISKKIIEFIIKNPEVIKFWDQDGLNAILHKKWLKINPRWNQQRNFFNRRLVKENISIQEEIDKAIKEPYIIHYTTASKPWHYSDTHPLKKEYYFYLKKTPWKNFKPEDKNFLNFLKKKLKEFLKIIGYYY